MQKNNLQQLVVVKSWVRKNSQIEPNDNKWTAIKENKVAKEIIQLLIDELDKNYNDEEKNINDNK